jgi:hypothetical protein
MGFFVINGLCFIVRLPRRMCNGWKSFTAVLFAIFPQFPAPHQHFKPSADVRCSPTNGCKFLQWTQKIWEIYFIYCHREITAHRNALFRAFFPTWPCPKTLMPLCSRVFFSVHTIFVSRFSHILSCDNGIVTKWNFCCRFLVEWRRKWVFSLVFRLHFVHIFPRKLEQILQSTFLNIFFRLFVLWPRRVKNGEIYCHFGISEWS